MKEADRLQLARILSTVDENFLIALSNKGLVRRAQKDLEGVTLQIEETEDAIVVRGSDWTVWMPASGPVKAKDDTIATGITRQILSATIYLCEHWSTNVLSSGSSSDGSQTTNLKTPQTVPEQVLQQIDQRLRTSEGGTPLESEHVSPPTSQVADRGTPQPEKVSYSAEQNSLKVKESSDTLTKVSGPTMKPHPVAQISDEGEKLKDALLSISVDEISKWAGKKLVGDLIVLLNESLEIEVECHLGVTIRLPQPKVEIRLLPTHERGLKLLDQLLSTAPKAMHKKWIATALLVLNRKSGKSLQLSSSTRVSVQSPRNQIQVLRESRKLLESILDNGVSHPSSRLIERLFTLSISASIVQLPRLSHLLKTLSDEVSHLLSRHASADTQRLFSLMSWTYSLVKALEKHAAQNEVKDSQLVDFPRELAGVARSQYDPVGDIELIGAGAYHWQTASGYQGLTVLFWDRKDKRFLTWSMSRPESTMSNADVESAYLFDSIWSGGSPQKLSRSKFLLKNARVNPFGRLSSGQQTTVENVSKSDFQSDTFEGRSFSNWRMVRAYAAQQFPVGLKMQNPLNRLVILEAKSWDDRFYDEMHQRFCWDLRDDSGESIRLTVPWNDCNERAIEFLESLKPGLEKINRVVARVEFSTTGLLFEPISMLSPGTRTGDTVLNPSFDHTLIDSKQSALLLRLRQKFGKDKIATSMTGDDDWEELQNFFDINQNVPPHIINAISETEGILLQVAESGTQRLNEKTSKRFKELGEKLSHSGLLALGESITSVSVQNSPAQSVLWSDYLCNLHKQTLSLAAVGSKQ